MVTNYKVGPAPPIPPQWKAGDKLPKAPPLPKGGPPPTAPQSKGPPAGYVTQQDVNPPEELDPDEARRQELLGKPDFARFVKLMKMKVPLLSILNQTRAAGVYGDDDVLLFATKMDITKLKGQGEYKGTKF